MESSPRKRCCFRGLFNFPPTPRGRGSALQQHQSGFDSRLAVQVGSWPAPQPVPKTGTRPRTGSGDRHLSLPFAYSCTDGAPAPIGRSKPSRRTSCRPEHPSSNWTGCNPPKVAMMVRVHLGAFVREARCHFRDRHPAGGCLFCTQVTGVRIPAVPSCSRMIRVGVRLAPGCGPCW